MGHARSSSLPPPVGSGQRYLAPPRVPSERGTKRASAVGRMHRSIPRRRAIRFGDSRTVRSVISLQDVEEAAGRLSGVAHRTPVLTSGTLDRVTGASVNLKAESFQRGGAFKFRGAYNRISSLDPQ